MSAPSAAPMVVRMRLIANRTGATPGAWVMTSSRGGPRFSIGSYQLVERVGMGRTAQVYRAIAEDGRTVAVKMLAPEAEADDPSALARFSREIEALGRLRHLNVIELVDHG